MKVILAGYPKTGTKTIAQALKILDYNVYDYLEHFWYHGEEWKKILTTGGNADDFKGMYQDVDAVTDTPVYFFWEQICEAFPDALIILTVREEECWFDSWAKLRKHTNGNWRLRLIWALSPFGWRHHQHFSLCMETLFGFAMPHVWSPGFSNESMMKNRYRMHNDYVLQKAPKDKLLIFNVKDGWEPLCKFLGKEIPNVAFPHKNANASLFQEQLKENPIMKRLHRETVMAGVVYLAVGMFGVQQLVRRDFSSWCSNVLRNFLADYGFGC